MTTTGRYRRVALLLALVALALSLTGSAAAQLRGVVCFFKGEQISGFNKICYYDCLGSLTAITIGSVELCPLTIQR